jgi:uncharacterized beta-barrel protein YwiB (DUF1934 family)
MQQQQAANYKIEQYLHVYENAELKTDKIVCKISYNDLQLIREISTQMVDSYSDFNQDLAAVQREFS